MDIGVPLRELGTYDISALREAILSQPEDAWLNNTFRQQEYDVHQMTHSLVMIFTDGSGCRRSRCSGRRAGMCSRRRPCP